MHLYLIIPPITAFALFFSLAVIVLLRDYRRITYRLFALFLVGMGLWGLIIFAFRTSPDIAHAKFWIQTLLPANLLTCSVFLHFSFMQTRAKVKVWVLIAVYALFFFILGMALAGKMVKDVTTDIYGFLPFYMPLYLIPSVTCYIYLIAGMGSFLKAYRKSTSFNERNSYLYFLFGISLAMLGGIWDFLSTTSLKLPPMGLVGTILFGILATIAILRYHLLDIRIVVRKSVAYILTSTVVAIPYVGIIILFNIFLQENLPVWAHILLLLGLALGLQAMWQRVQRLVDRWFYREQYDFLKELERFSQEAHDISNLSELGSSLVGLISRAFQTASVHLLLLNELGNFRTVSYTGAHTQQIILQRRSPLIQWLNQNKGILHRPTLELDPKLQSMTAREKSDIADARAELFIPLKMNTGELVGLLMMGPKRSDQPYSDEDLRRIITVTSRMAVEMENARLYARETAMRQELQKLDEQKTEFLHHVAHELKTPLTAIISSSELMTADDIVRIPLEQRERLLNNINRSAWLMDKKVGELLDLARIQIGSLELKFEPLDVGELIDDIASQLSSLFKNKEQSIETNVPATLPRVRADRERTTEVILNLLSNANKFSPAGTHVAIVASQRDNMVLMEVKDSAPVIDELDRSRLFEAYYRGGNSEDKQRVSGLGLGLAISKRLIELQKGEIGVLSEEGRGNTFYFTLPIWNDAEREDS